MNRVIIATSKLNKEIWTNIYRLIKGIREEKESKFDAFEALIKETEMRVASYSLDKDVYSLYGEMINTEKLSVITNDASFSIIYKKADDSEDFAELVPLVLLQKEFEGIVSMGIDVQELEIEKQEKYYFKCSNFFFLYNQVRPKCGEKDLYFIGYTKKETDEVTHKKKLIYHKTHALAGRSNSQKLPYNSASSRRFLPLIHINKDSFQPIFGIYNNNDSTSEKSEKSEKSVKADESENISTQKAYITEENQTQNLNVEIEKDIIPKQEDSPGTERDKKLEENLSFIRGSINKINSDFTKKKKYSQVKAYLSPIFNGSNSLFGKWLESGYFYSFIEERHSDVKPNEIQGIRNTLQIYKNSIFEIVQNIMFHGGKDGVLYCEFVKKSNISKSNSEHIPGFEEYKDDNRFLRIGIFDFSDRGIVDTFNDGTDGNKVSLSLDSFFNPDSIEATGLTHLNMRYAARLGIKTFVKNIIKFKGYFSVESNQTQNGEKTKKRLFSFVKENKILLSLENEVCYANGTHYEIILPVVAAETPISRTIPFQRESFFSLNLKRYMENIKNDYIVIQDNLINEDILNKIIYSENKDDQKIGIENLGNEIINKSSNKKEIAIDLGNHDYDSNTIFKLLAYLQLKDDNGFKTIILINSKDSLVDNICEFVKSTLIDRTEIIWSDESAIIFVTDNLRVQILNGSTKGALFSINHECHKYYSYESNYFDYDKSLYEPGLNLAQKFSDFIFPYEFRVRLADADKSPYFMDALKAMFRRRIVSDKPGYLVNHEYTYIGSKIIVKNYYEADTMFQNSFFTERLAHLISLKIQEALDAQQETKELVLIGYKYYSEFLLKAIKTFLKSEDLNQDHIHLVIANDEKDALEVDDIDFIFDRKTDQEGNSIQDYILDSPENFCFITIVPIGSTLSTHDKIIAFFKLWFKNERERLNKANERDNLDNDLFIYNHCVVVVRDRVQNRPTVLEKRFKWKNIDFEQSFIETRFDNAQRVHYTIQIASNLPGNNWISLFNQEVSFPLNWQDEKYVNFTSHSSTNLHNIMGFPLVNATESQYKKELKRLFAFKDYTHKGHIEAYHTHHKYYIDTESFAKQNIDELKKWLAKLKEDNKIFKSNVLNVLITPNSESESDFIYAINNTLFDGNALVLFLDVNNWHGNTLYKFSFLKDLKKVHFHYVDQMLLTGRSFYKTKSHLFAIRHEEHKNMRSNNQEEGTNVGNKDNNNKRLERENWQFSSIIAIMNRLPYEITDEIKNEVNNNLFIYTNLFYPATKDSGHKCELCELKKYYEKLKERTVLESCSDVIKRNIKRLEKRSFKPSIRLNQKENKNSQEQKSHKENNESNRKRRNFIRLLLTHELYYRISKIELNQNHESNSYDKKINKIYNELDDIYQQITSPNYSKNHEQDNDKKSEMISSIYSDELYGCQSSSLSKELKDYYNKKLGIDLKISFLKVISSPPLSQYIFMRSYAHEKLLLELNRILSPNIVSQGVKKTIDDLRMLKAILKSLSFLKSNALVRKDVITGAWRLLEAIVNDLNHDSDTHIESILKHEKDIIQEKKDSEIKELNDIEHQLNAPYIYLVNNTVSSMPTIDFEKPRREEVLKTQKKGHEEVLCRLEKDMSLLNAITDILECDKKNNNGNEIIEDFSRDFQFFIKNAIIEDETKATFLGELLRTGEEMKIPTQDEFNSCNAGETNEIQISKTEMSLKDGKHPVNDLFNQNFKNKAINQEYIIFLVMVFYDNTTIIRRTLDNFTKEKDKDKSFHMLFYHGDRLKDIEEIKNDINKIKEMYSRKINNVYYYSTFKPYLKNGDRIDYLEKLLYLTYAKLKLNDLTSGNHTKYVERDTRYLLEIFASIMGASAAFFVMKSEDQLLFPVLYDSKKSEAKWNFKWDIDVFYTGAILRQKISAYKFFKFPLIPVYSNSKYNNGEHKILNAYAFGVYLISDIENSRKDSTPLHATITFLYQNNENKDVDPENFFRVNFQEYGRLLLLLKNEINNKYVIDFLVKDKVFDLWTLQLKSAHRFDNVYLNSSHSFGAYLINKNLDFDFLEKEDLAVVWEAYLHHTNQIICQMYSNISKEGELTLDLIGDGVRINDIFDDKFVYLLKNGFKDRWWGTLVIDNTAEDTDITYFHKQILRTFVVQCIDNAGHKHLRNTNKSIHLNISSSKIIIQNDFGDNVKSDIENERMKFKKKRRTIDKLQCENYNHMTLIAINGYCKRYNYVCNFTFHNDYFSITINIVQR